MQFFVKGLCSNPIWPREGPGLQELPGVGNFFIKPPPSFQIRYFLAQKGMFLSPSYVFRDFLCHADIGKHIKYYYYDQNLVGMARPLNVV